VDRHGEEAQFHVSLSPEGALVRFVGIMADMHSTSHQK
jgi:hypothetical protein